MFRCFASDCKLPFSISRTKILPSHGVVVPHACRSQSQPVRRVLLLRTHGEVPQPSIYHVIVFNYMSQLMSSLIIIIINLNRIIDLIH